jgi:HEAT repeat protein
LLKQPSFFRWAAIRAVGIQRARDFAPRLREFLGCDNELERGCALLALARIGDPNDRARILNGVHEASDSFEKVMAMLALISLAPDLYSTIQVNLRRYLADFSFAFWQPARRDIISVLESTGVDDARTLADNWRPFYSGSGKVPTSSGR